MTAQEARLKLEQTKTNNFLKEEEEKDRLTNEFLIWVRDIWPSFLEQTLVDIDLALKEAIDREHNYCYFILKRNIDLNLNVKNAHIDSFMFKNIKKNLEDKGFNVVNTTSPESFYLTIKF
jgi:hypothetical protein